MAAAVAQGGSLLKHWCRRVKAQRPAIYMAIMKGSAGQRVKWPPGTQAATHYSQQSS